MVAYPFRAPSGIPGDLTRLAAGITVEPNVQDATLPVTAYGRAVKLSNTGGMTPITSGDALADVYGISVRAYPVQSQSTANYGGTTIGSSGVPPEAGALDILKRGYINVRLYGSAAAAKGGPVYIWTAASAGTHIQVGFEATSPGGDGFEVTNAYFTGAADADGNAEIAYNL
jgi:hypothetical protein